MAVASLPDWVLESIFEFFCLRCGRSLGSYSLSNWNGDVDELMPDLEPDAHRPVVVQEDGSVHWVWRRTLDPKDADRPSGRRGPRTGAGLYLEENPTDEDGLPWSYRVRCGCGHSRRYRADRMAKLFELGRPKKIWL